MSLMPALRSLAAPLTRPRKGDVTRAAIVEAALAIARRDGLEGLTIGALADALGMSKSGVFAHFGSREELQVAVMTEYQRRFVDEVLKPAVRAARGLPRLAALIDNWLRLLARELEHGCLMIGGSVEYDDREGSLHDLMVEIVGGWKRELLRAIAQAVAEGHLRADTDAEQLVFEIHGLMLALHQDARLMRSKDSVRRARAGVGRLMDGATTARGRTALRKAAVAATQVGGGASVARATGARRPQSKQGRSPGRPQTDLPSNPERVHVRPAGLRKRATKSRTRATSKQE